jgi:hypothetical protein
MNADSQDVPQPYRTASFCGVITKSQAADGAAGQRLRRSHPGDGHSRTRCVLFGTRAPTIVHLTIKM